MVDGLIVKDGRLINLRPPGETGIAQAARLRKEVKRARKIEMIADGIAVAEARHTLKRK